METEGARSIVQELQLTMTTCFFRLALSHNKIATFPARFSECTLLRYLNIRNNRITEFPLAVRASASNAFTRKIVSDLLSSFATSSLSRFSTSAEIN